MYYYCITIATIFQASELHGVMLRSLHKHHYCELRSIYSGNSVKFGATMSIRKQLIPFGICHYYNASILKSVFRRHKRHIRTLPSRRCLHSSPFPSRRVNADVYGILGGIPRDATNAEVKRQYYKLAKTYHPDRNHGDKHAAAKVITAQLVPSITRFLPWKRQITIEHPRWIMIMFSSCAERGAVTHNGSLVNIFPPSHII